MFGFTRSKAYEHKRGALALIALGLALVGLRAAPSALAQGQSVVGTVWVADEGGDSITVIDAATNAVVTTLTGIEGPHNLQAAPDGASIWAISGHDAAAVHIDARTYSVLGTVQTGQHPAHIVVTPEGETVYVTNGNDDSVTVIDATDYRVVKTIPVGDFPHGLRPSPDGRWVYVANTNSTTVSVIDTASNERVADIDVGARPVQVAFDPNGDYVYVSLNADNAVAKVDVATQTLVGTVAVGTGPIQVFVAPDNSVVLVANQGTEVSPGTSVSIIATETFTVVDTVETGQGAHGVVIEPSGHYAYIANLYGNDVAVIDLSTRDVIARIPTGVNPNGVSFSPQPPAETDELRIELASSTTQTTQDDHSAHHDQADVTPTPEPQPPAGDHAAHHPGDTTAPTEIPDATEPDMSAMMQPMMDLMAEMMMMDMSGEMMALMGDLHGALATMADSSMMDQMGDMDHAAMMQSMMEMVDEMMGMDMSGDMMGMMHQVRGMMSMMHAMMPGMQTGPGDDMSDHDRMNASESGHAMTPVSSQGVVAATEATGGQLLDYVLDNGVKVFEITARPVLWNILDGVTVTAWTYNGTVPGPLLRVIEGDRVRVVFTNTLPEPTTVHFHGNTLINVMDGVPNVTQNPIEPGETFVYEFTAGPSGTFWYHSHLDTDVQIGLGLYAPLIIEPAQAATSIPDVDVTLMLSEWRIVDGQTYPAMPMAGAEPNYFTINGKAFPATEQIDVKVGQRVRIRFVNAGQFVHPMHTHGTSFQVVATDGHAVPDVAQLTKDTISVAPGERYDIEFIATEPGMWAVHCHVLHHVTNDGAEPGGLTVVVNVTE